MCMFGHNAKCSQSSTDINTITLCHGLLRPTCTEEQMESPVSHQERKEDKKTNG